jgi:formylglycine-generating enzyme required for sulfatase activity
MRRRGPRIAASLILLAAVDLVLTTTGHASGEMVPIPTGTFLMGISRNQPDDEGPEHEVYLEAYRIDRYEVTNAGYRRCVAAGACSEPADLRYYDDPRYATHPVVFVTWYNARDYCRWRGRRLPTEAEWEKAARGDDGRSYPWGNERLGDRLNAGNGLGGTTPVGSFPSGASPYGVLDMAGNVWEWVGDWYEAYPGSTFRSDLLGQKYKVVRGGSWNHPVEDARTFHRDIAHPGRAIGVVGLRCAAPAR